MGDIDIRFYLSILLRRLPHIIVLTVITTAIALAIALLMPKSYRSTAKILVEAPQIPTNLVKSTVPTSSLEQLLILQQQMTTGDNLVQLADKLDVYGTDKEALSTDAVIKDMRSRITFDQLPLGDGATTVFSIVFEAGTSELAAKAANELASSILLDNQRQRTGRAGDTLRFFNDEVNRLDVELNRIEADLLKFKTDHKETLPESLEFRRQQQASQQERLVALGREEADLRARRSLFAENAFTTGNVGPLSTEQQMLLDLNKALAEQLAIFSEDSPNIINLRSRIAALRGRSTAKANGEAGKQGASALDLQLADIDKRLETIERERASLTQSIADLTKSVSATPATETALNAIERNLGNIQTQYNTAIARRAEASIGTQIEARSDGGRFSLLEAAKPPEMPVKSKRLLVVFAGALGGIGLGLGLTILLEMMNRTIRRPSELSQLLQRQPLGVIPYIASPADTAGGFYNKRFAAAAVSASVIPAFLLIIHYFYTPLASAFQRLLSGFMKPGSM
jgi:polysaccharide chain length determinant protein (PEP-CTERM system associated)